MGDYRGDGIPRDKVGAIPPEEFRVLPGPPMNPAERRIAGATSPKTAEWERICRGYNSRLGCKDNDCARGRVVYKNYERLAAAVKISSAQRLDFKKT